ncbi:hypothetical protein ACJROX_05750 [Pseudalkalibacillus sp. A8]|uniref:hypothetical protein n=1 Tax=Pseudalkalibacillus sp. A8 TaxID=3382641 RepID=UPI0038B5FD66
MIALTSLHKLQQIKEKIEVIKMDNPDVYRDILHLISLTRQLQFRYQYLACLLTEEDAGSHYPNFTKQSVIDLYVHEVNRIKATDHNKITLELFSKNKECGYDKICLLFLGISPEKLKGIG